MEDVLLASSSSAVVSMNGSGEGDASYANNSNFQRFIASVTRKARRDMAAAGLVDEERVHSFNAPYYAPCPDDLTRVIAEEGSFALRTLQLFDTTRRHLLLGGGPASRHPTSSNKHDGDDELPRWLAAETAATIKAVVEPMLRTHFGWAAMDGLFCRYRLLLEAYYRSKATRNKDDITNVFLVLEKKQRCY